jgi:hypothetical protein
MTTRATLWRNRSGDDVTRGICARIAADPRRGNVAHKIQTRMNPKTSVKLKRESEVLDYR